MRAKDKKLVRDFKPGTRVQVAAGLVVLLDAIRGGQRWARILRDDLRETDAHLYLDLDTPVLVVLEPPALPMVPDGDNVDPLALRAP